MIIIIKREVKLEVIT